MFHSELFSTRVPVVTCAKLTTRPCGFRGSPLAMWLYLYDPGFHPLAALPTNPVRFYDLWVLYVFFLSDKRQCIIKNAAVHHPILAEGTENLRLHWRVQSTRRSYAGPPARLGTPAGMGLRCSPGACHVSGIPTEPRATSESSGLFCTDYLGTLQSLKYSARSDCLQRLCGKEKRHNNYPLCESEDIKIFFP